VSKTSGDFHPGANTIVPGKGRGGQKLIEKGPSSQKTVAEKEITRRGPWVDVQKKPPTKVEGGRKRRTEEASMSVQDGKKKVLMNQNRESNETNVSSRTGMSFEAVSANLGNKWENRDCGGRQEGRRWWFQGKGPRSHESKPGPITKGLKKKGLVKKQSTRKK